ncbi:MAG TPA: hypothetical protein VHP11_15000, partial [Tepidisphaeraceae bacterium]|nr:hypothetical protein [Tepidisphaeraceae bacterium]
MSRFDWSASLETVGAMVVGSNQQVIVGGLFNHAQCRQRTGLARFQADGYIDDTFAPVLSPAPSRIEPVVAALVLQPDGRLIIGGKFSAANGYACPGLARLNYDGSTDPSFAPTQALVAVQALVLQPDQKVLVAGATTLNDYGIPETPALLRLLPNGLPDPSFSFTNAYQDLIRNLLLLPDGKILVNGTLRLNPDGTQDGTFTSVELEGYMVCASLLQPDGKVLLALSDPEGAYPTTGGALVRLLPGGGYDPSFTTQTFYRDSSAEGITANLFALALQADGRIYVGGGFGAIGDDASTLVARLWPNGELDRSFQPSFTYSPGADLPEFVTHLAIQADGKLLVGGYFGGINGFSRQNLARLH